MVGFRSLEVALTNISQQMEGYDVTLTLDVLRRGKRYIPTTNFTTSTGLQEATERVKGMMALMREFPLNPVLSASSLSRLATACKAVFSHYNQYLKKVGAMGAEHFPRALYMLEAVQQEVVRLAVKLLGPRRLMKVPYERFTALTNECLGLTELWCTSATEVQYHLADTAKRRGQHSHNLHNAKPKERMTNLGDRLHTITTFRRQHEQLRAVIRKTFASVQQVRDAGTVATPHPLFSSCRVYLVLCSGGCFSLLFNSAPAFPLLLFPFRRSSGKCWCRRRCRRRRGRRWRRR